jgi:hypothetical protein
MLLSKKEFVQQFVLNRALTVDDVREQCYEIVIKYGEKLFDEINELYD